MLWEDGLGKELFLEVDQLAIGSGSAFFTCLTKNVRPFGAQPQICSSVSSRSRTTFSRNWLMTFAHNNALAVALRPTGGVFSELTGDGPRQHFCVEH